MDNNNKELTKVMKGMQYNTNMNHAYKHYMKAAYVLESVGDITSKNHNVTELILMMDTVLREVESCKNHLMMHRAILNAKHNTQRKVG